MNADRNVSAPNAQFDGSIPEFYDRYLGPLLFEPYAVDLARRVAKIQPRKRVEAARYDLRGAACYRVRPDPVSSF